MEALPIGTIRVWTENSRKRVYLRRVVKVSHHGPKWSRWRPCSHHVWQQEIGPIPEGFEIYHRNGDSLNDALDNLVLVREDRLKLLLANPRTSRRQRKRQAYGVRRSNRRRAHAENSQLQDDKFYVVVPSGHMIVWIPCLTLAEARRRITPDRISRLVDSMRDATIATRGIRLSFTPGDFTCVVTGEEIRLESGIDGKYEGFIRLIPDTRRAPRKRNRSADLVEALSAN